MAVRISAQQAWAIKILTYHHFGENVVDTHLLANPDRFLTPSGLFFA